MAGGVGGTGNSPGGVSGQTGVTESQGTSSTVPGGLGGANNFILVDGSSTYGPYGTGGVGADSLTTTGTSGNPGGVVISWGGGNSKNVYYKSPKSISATSSGAGSGGGGPSGNPGTQTSTTGGNSVHINTYAPISKYWTADSTGTNAFAWSRAFAFTAPVTNITTAEMQAWGFDPSDVVPAYGISLTSFSAGVDSSWTIGWALIDHGASNLSYSYNYSVLGQLGDSQPDRHFRSSNSDPFSDGTTPYGLGPWSIPVPGANSLLYIWCVDGSGTDTRTITMSYTS